MKNKNLINKLKIYLNKKRVKALKTHFILAKRNFFKINLRILNLKFSK